MVNDNALLVKQHHNTEASAVENVADTLGVSLLLSRFCQAFHSRDNSEQNRVTGQPIQTCILMTTTIARSGLTPPEAI